jgi:phosphohistidine swiveling domain-containing protein
VLAGWLYVRARVRDLDGSGTPLPAAVALQRLERDMLPAARARLRAVESRLRGGDGDAIAAAIDEAVRAFFAMIDDYLGVLIPARRAAARAARAVDPDHPFSLRARADHADVLPARWDVAAPTLAELGLGDTPPGPGAHACDDAAAATLLGEWDDHLFALGLAPLRRVYLAAAAALGLDAHTGAAAWAAAFGLEPPELADALRSPRHDLAERIATRRADYERWSRLRPPACIVEGEAVPALPRGRWRGLPIGPDASGPLAQRRDLEHLVADPPPADAIVVMPSLTAQAAVALRALGVAAVCCEHGGALSHAALMARELGLSALIGCRGCTEAEDGAPARIDTRAGRLLVASRAATPR